MSLLATPKRSSQMGRKKGTRKTVMVRVYEETANLITQAAGERRLTAAEFCESFLTPCADKAHREYIKAEVERLKGQN